MSAAETNTPPGMPEEENVTQIRRSLFEMCMQRVEVGDLDPAEIPSEVNRLLGHCVGLRVERSVPPVAAIIRPADTLRMTSKTTLVMDKVDL